jgi:hypothetical protein
MQNWKFEKHFPTSSYTAKSNFTKRRQQITPQGGCFLNDIDVEEESEVLIEWRNRIPVSRGRTNLGAVRTRSEKDAEAQKAAAQRVGVDSYTYARAYFPATRKRDETQ